MPAPKQVEEAKSLQGIAEENLTPEERQVCNQFSLLEDEDCTKFNRLGDDRAVGLVYNTIYVEKTPSYAKTYEPFLTRLGLRGQYLLGLLWLLKHPLFAARASELPKFAPSPGGLSESVRSFVTDNVSLEEELEPILARKLTFGSTLLIYVDDVIYAPLWPSLFVASEGRFGDWGSAVLEKV